jgi:hypothetical protein
LGHGGRHYYPKSIAFRTTKILVFSDLNVYKTPTNSFGTLPEEIQKGERK